MSVKKKNVVHELPQKLAKQLKIFKILGNRKYLKNLKIVSKFKT